MCIAKNASVEINLKVNYTCPIKLMCGLAEFKVKPDPICGNVKMFPIFVSFVQL